MIQITMHVRPPREERENRLGREPFRAQFHRPMERSQARLSIGEVSCQVGTSWHWYPFHVHSLTGGNPEKAWHQHKPGAHSKVNNWS